MKLKHQVHSGFSMSTIIFCTFFFFLICTSLTAQTLDFTTTDSECESNGSIMVTCTGCSPNVQFQISAGPICLGGNCPVNDSPDGTFNSLPSGTYTVVAIGDSGIEVSGTAVVGGNYQEPIPMANFDFACPGQMDANINITGTTNGTMPFEYRAFVGVVGDYPGAIGPTEAQLPFTSATSFTGFGTGVHSYQVMDACGVIRTGELVISDAPPFSISTNITCTDQDNCETTIGVSYFTGSIFLTDSRLANYFPMDIYVVAEDGTEYLGETLMSPGTPQRYPLTQCGQNYRLRFETACDTEVLSNLREFKCVSDRILFNEFCNTTTNQTEFSFSYSLTRGECTNQQIVTVYNCDGSGDISSPVIYEGPIEGFTPPISDGESYYFNITNTCTDSTHVIGCITPAIDPLNWRRYPSCNDLPGFESFVIQEFGGITIIDAPAGYSQPLPDTLERVFYHNVFSEPIGTYVLTRDEGCGLDTFTINVEDSDFSFQLDSTDITCQTTTFFFSHSRTGSVANNYFPRGAVGYFNTNGSWINLGTFGIGSAESGTQQFTLDNSLCVDNLMAVVYQTIVSPLIFTCEIDLGGQCYQAPDGVNVIGLPCQDGIQMCDDGSQPYNILATAPEMDGLGPFTWEIFVAGTNTLFVPQIVTPDTFIVLEEVCVDDLTLDIFVTDACGQQIMSEIGFGVLTLDLLLEEMTDICSSETYDLNSIVKNVVIGGTWTATDGGPAPDMDGIVTPALTDEGCFNYNYQLTPDNLPGICSNLDVPFVLCIGSGTPSITCPDTLVVECDGLGNPLELQAWIDGAMATGGCSDTSSVSIVANLIESVPGNGVVTTNTYEFVADDGNGTVSTCISQFIIEDTTAPAVVGADGSVSDTVGCDENFEVALEAWLNSIVVTDACGEPEVITELVSVSEVCDGTNLLTTYMYSITGIDGVGNNSTVVMESFYKFDNVPPTIVGPADLEIECGGENLALITNWLMDYEVTEACQEVIVTNDWDGMIPDLCPASSVPVTWTVSDACGANSSTTANIIVIPDTEGPEFLNCPSDMTVNVDADLCTANVIYSTPVATDCNEVASVILTSGPASGTPFDLGDNTILFTATDNCGNETTCSFVITVEDSATPLIFCPGNLTVCTDPGICDWTSADELIPSSMENCPGMAISHTIVSADGSIDITDAAGPVAAGTVFPLGINTITYTVTDGVGLTSSCTFTVEVEDCETPIIMCPMAMTVECDGSGNMTDLNNFLMGATISDNCTMTIVATTKVFNTMSSCGNTSTTTYEFSAIDDAGNETKCYADFIIEDQTEPIIATAAVDVVAECDGNGNIAGFISWIASNGGILDSEVTEDCGNFVFRNNLSDVVFIENASCTGEVGSWEVDFWVEDECGNISTPVTLSYIIEDTMEPSIVAPANITIQCGDATNTGTIDNWLAQFTSSDICSITTVTNDFGAGPMTCGDVVTVTWTATDACGNMSTTSAMVEMIDDEKPIVMVPPTPLFLSCGVDNATTIENWLLTGGGAVVIDNCGNDLDITTNVLYDNMECEGNQEIGYEFTFADLCGNATTIASNIVINDISAPEITSAALDLNVTCDGTGNANDLESWLALNGGATTTDSCSSVSWSHHLISSINNCGDTGTDTYVFTASDACGNAVSDTALFTIMPSIIELTGGADFMTECESTTGGNDIELFSWLNNNAGITAMNECGEIVWTNDFDNINWVDGCNDGQSIDVTFTATDACGNAESLTFNFSTSDNTAPEFINCPLDTYFFETPFGSCEAFGNFSLPIAEDNCGDPTVEQTDGTGLTSGSLFPIGITVLEFTATDECGNSSICTVNIEVTDISNSVMVSCPDSVAVGNDMNECGATVEDISLVIEGNICDNDSDITFEILDSLGQVIGSGDTDASGTFFPIGNNTVSYSFLDEFGNETECSFLVSVSDIEAPVCQSDGGVSYAQTDTIISVSELDCGAEFTWNHPIFSDNCMSGSMEVTYEFIDTLNDVTTTDSEVLLSLNGSIDLDGESVSRIFEVGQTIITYILEDQFGNLNVCSFIVNVEANEAPVFETGCVDIEITLDPGECAASIYPPIDLTNTCGIDTVIYSIDGEPLDLFNIPIGINEVEIQAIDVFGNVGVCNIVITVNEFENSINSLTCNDAINLSLDANCEAIVTVDMILEGGPYGCLDDFCIEVTNSNGDIVDAVFDLDDVGSTFDVSIVDCEGSGNSCWGTVTIENKLIPELICPADTMLTCNQDPNEVYPMGHPQVGELIYGMAFIETCEIDATITYTDELLDYGECAEPRVELIRTWKIEDADGNEVTCEQNFEFMPFEASLIQYPEDLILDNSLECSDVESNPVLTEPENTGFPTFGGQPIIGNNYCDIHLGYWDEFLVDVNCPSAYLIYRHWVIDNECLPIQDGVNPLEYVQRIKVKDSKAPIISGIDDVTINVDQWTCEGTYELPNITNTDECSDFVVEWHASYGQIIGNEITKLALGQTDVNVKVSDACGNVSFASFTITAFDFNPPTIISETQHTVSLAQDGIAKVFAEDLDDGSYDGCTDINFAVMRMDQGGSCLPQDYFDPPGDDNAQLNEVVHFCCSDVGDDPVMVMLQVCDDANQDGIFDSEEDNCNQVMIEVFVQEKLIPQIICPAPITISCVDLAGLDLDDTDLLDGLFGTAIAAGTCGVDVTQSTIGNELCGDGVLIRNFTATNSVGTASCQQFITVEAGLSQTLTCDRIAFEDLSNTIYDWCSVNDNINDNDDDLPALEIDCNDGLNIPALSINIDGLCTQVGEQYTIDTFNFAGGACKKYVIHYEVIDQCVFDENYVDPITGELDPFNSDNGYFELYLEVDAFDNEEPEPICDALSFTSQSCTGYDGSFGISGSDNCTETEYLSYQWRIDVGADDEIDFPSSGWFTTQEVSPDQLGLTEFPIGEHIVYWIISDGCGNNGTCAQTINIMPEDKEPTPYCIDGLSIAVMPANGTVDLWANDFDAGSFDNCGGELTLTMVPVIDVEGLNYLEAYGQSFSHPNVTQQTNGDYGFTFDCSYIPNGVTSIIEVRIYVTDENGKWDYCTASLRLDDNFDACVDDGSLLTFDASGTLKTENDDDINNVEVEVDAAFPEFPYSESFDGYYAFDLFQDIDYVISPLKNDNHLNGITSFDLLKIQKHILGLEILESPYLKIAADVNSDCKINGLDIIQLRKLLLGKYQNDELPDNTAWRFVESDHQFVDITQPCNYPEVSEIFNMNSNEINDFVGVKIGDLNGSANNNLTVDSDIRSDETIQFELSENITTDGSSAYIDFKLVEATNLYGFQMNIDFNASSFIEMKAGIVDLNNSNIGFSEDNSSLLISYDNVQGVSVNEGVTMFTIKVKKSNSTALADALRLNKFTFSDEAYVDVNLLIKDIEFIYPHAEVLKDEFDLFQNEPNPFSEQTNIMFSIPESGLVKFSIYDVNGVEHYRFENTFAKGLNQINLTQENIGKSGVFYYKLEMGSFLATKKMIVLID